jgi:5-methyltetrahydrofolate corrinoid/iron sulfur protein methyltransferase
MNLFQESLRPHGGAARRPLLLIGQDMHILNPVFHRALAARDSRALAAMAVRQAEAGADALDLNLGPAGKDSGLLAWAMETVLAAARLPLFTASQVLARPELLLRHGEKLTVNAVTADPVSLPDNMALARDCGAGLTVLLTRPGLTACSADDRLLLAAEVLEAAEKNSLPLSRLYLDPLFQPGPHGLADLEPMLEWLAELPFLSREKARSVAALSSASAFLPAAKRPACHQRLLPLLAEAGLDAVILNCNDRRLMDIARSIGDGATPVPLAEAAG